MPFTSFVEIHDPSQKGPAFRQQLWPRHCVQQTPGAEIVKELDLDLVDEIIEKVTSPTGDTVQC